MSKGSRGRRKKKREKDKREKGANKNKKAMSYSEAFQELENITLPDNIIDIKEN